MVSHTTRLISIYLSIYLSKIATLHFRGKASLRPRCGLCFGKAFELGVRLKDHCARSSSNWRRPTCTRGVRNATTPPTGSDRCQLGWWPRLPASSQRRPYFQTGHAARYRYRSPPRQKARAERPSRRFARRCCEQPRLLCSWATRGSRRTALPPMAVTNTQFGPPFSKFSSGHAPHPRP